MIIITEERLIEYTKQHPDAASSLLRWGALVRAAKWRNVADTRRTFSHADPVGQCTIFNIKGNDYRLITGIDYGYKRSRLNTSSPTANTTEVAGKKTAR